MEMNEKEKKKINQFRRRRRRRNGPRVTGLQYRYG
jgi:hypothetical protein